MSQTGSKDGFAVALAWPATFCKAPGSWYDPVTALLGINRNNYYRAGHAALVLIDKEELECHYFDFGRYHAPYQHGRVRGVLTDHDLAMNSIPRVSADRKKLENLDEILSELQLNAACHGDGPLHASYTSINFNAAREKVLEMQGRGPIPYGPFVSGGSNCSRFVHTAILAGNPRKKFKLKYFMPLTPTPMSNVRAFRHRKMVPVMRKDLPFYPVYPLSKEELVSTLKEPERNVSIPPEARWLSGEGVGSWFDLSLKDGLLSVTRYAPDGKSECMGDYREDLNGSERSQLSQLGSDYSLDHPSNCFEVRINIAGEILRFERAFE